MAGKVLEVTDTDFDAQVLKSPLPVLVDFWAPWCGPCKSIAPVLEEIAGEYAGRITVAKLNVDDNPRTASQYSIRAIPNIIIFKGGKAAEQVVGALPKDQLIAAITKVL